MCLKQFLFVLSVWACLCAAHENVWLDPSHIPEHSTTSDSYLLRHARLQPHFSEKNATESSKVQRNLCHEVVFENNTLKHLEYESPVCILESDGDNVRPVSEHSRRKRETFYRNLPLHFTIPSTRPSDEIKENSYIEMQFHVCAEPGAEVLVFDKKTQNTIFAFRNGGGSYHCNSWPLKNSDNKERAVSDSNEIQIEYKLPSVDYVLSNVEYTFPSENQNTGHRSIQYSGEDNLNILDLQISYKELKFIYYDLDILRKPDTEHAYYEANMVKTFIIPKRTDCSNLHCNYVGIQIEISELDLNFNKGDYVLIGPGSKPRFWSSSRSQIIARKIDKTSDEGSIKIWVHADSAFIMIVTHNSLKKPGQWYRGLSFSWKKPETLIEDAIADEASRFLRESSIELCFSGGNCDAWKTNIRYDFIEEAVHIFNKYLMDHKKDITTLIGRDSVMIFDVEGVSFPGLHRKDNYCRLNLAISSPYDKSFPLVSGDELRKMFFGSDSSRKVLHSKVIVTDCVYQHISLLSILLPIAVMLTISGIVVFIFWRIQEKVLQAHALSRHNSEQHQHLNAAGAF